MTTLKIKENLIANLIGKIWTVLMSIVFLPYYISLIGIESYGLVGFFTTLTMLFSLLDLGLSTTSNREVARLSGDRNNHAELKNFSRTLEYIYWPIGILIGVIVYIAAPLLANH